MNWWLVLPALKPERMILSHAGLYIALALYFPFINSIVPFCIALAAFLLFYGAIYLINDVIDEAADKKDPHNKTRLIASGKLGKKNAVVAGIMLLVCSLFLLFMHSITSFMIASLLLLINIVYSFVIKNFVPYFDIVFIAITQPLKYVVGVSLCGVGASGVLPAVPLLTVLYLAAVSLHAEKQLGKLSSGRSRTFTIGKYSEEGLRIMENIALGLSLFAFVFTFGKIGFWGAVLIIVVEVWLRFAFTAPHAHSLVDRLENTFQPR